MLGCAAIGKWLLTLLHQGSRHVQRFCMACGSPGLKRPLMHGMGIRAVRRLVASSCGCVMHDWFQVAAGYPYMAHAGVAQWHAGVAQWQV